MLAHRSLSAIFNKSLIMIFKLQVKRTRVGRINLATQYPIRVGSVRGLRRHFRGRITCLQIYGAAMDADQIKAVKRRCNAPIRTYTILLKPIQEMLNNKKV